MIFHIIIQLLLLANFLCHLALLTPKRNLLYILACFALIGLPWSVNAVFPGGGAHIFTLPVFMPLFSIYASYVTYKLALQNSFPETLFTSFVVMSYMQVVFAGFYLCLVAAGFPPGAQSMVIARIAYAVLTLALIPVFHRYLRTPYQKLLSAATRQKWYVIFPMQACFNFLGYSSVTVTMSHINGAGLAVSIAGMLAVVCFYAALYLFVTREQDYQFLQSRVHAARQLEQTYAFYDHALKEREERMRILRHDLRHILHSLESRAKEAPYDALATYLRNSEALLDNEPEVLCQNHTVNAVVSLFFSQARQNGTAVSAHLQVPQETPLPEAELSLILGNALENCVKATKPLGEMGYIKVSIRPERGYLLFHFTNNYRKGGYATGERLGLASMEKLCALHEGRMSVQDDGQEYQLTLII